MAFSSTTEIRSLESTVAKTASAIQIEIPSSQTNPFIHRSNAKQGTLYLIIFPIIAAIILIYLAGAIIKKYRANKQAKKVEPFDRDYEFYDYHNESIRENDETTLNPFGNDFEVGNASFIKNHQKQKSSVDLISQYRRSMDFLSGSRELDAAATHQKVDSKGSVLQINFNERPNLNPESYLNSETTTNDSPVFYSVVNTPGGGNHVNDDSRLNNSKPSDTSSSFYSIAEPQKAASSINSNNHSKTQHFHTRTPSSQALDDFISTGELPVLTQTPNNIPQKHSKSPIINSHSMFENKDASYGVPVIESRIRQEQVTPRSPSPERQRIYMQTVASRSPSRSPVRSERSSTRGSMSSPSRNTNKSSARSPTRNPFLNA